MFGGYGEVSRPVSWVCSFRLQMGAGGSPVWQALLLIE